ncbi:lysophosphatidic acid receptor 6, partial [Brachionus plicatilis]
MELVNASASSFEWRYKVNQSLLQIALYTLMPIGVAMNTIQIFVYLRKKFVKNSMNPFLIALPLNSIFVLILISLRFADTIQIFNYEQNTDIGCKFASFFIRLFLSGCFWLNFLLTIDRLFFILYPNKFKKLQHTNNIIKIIFLMYLLLAILCSPSFFFNSSRTLNSKTNETKLSCVAHPALSISRIAIVQLFGMFVPFFLMFGTNIVLIRKVAKSRKKFASAKEMNFAFSLIISNILFLVSFIPFSIFLISNLLKVINPRIAKDPKIGSLIALYDTCAFIIACYNFSLGLLIQIIFNKLFRK